MTNKNLLNYIRNTGYFRQTNEVIQQGLAANLEQVSLAEGEYLFHEGDANDGMYIIMTGHLQVTVIQQNGEQLLVGEQHAGEIVGEMAMLTWGKRTATVQAVAKTDLLKISKTTLERLIEKNPETLSQLGAVMLQRLHRNQLATIAANVFGPKSLEILDDIEPELTWVHLDCGEQLIRQGEMGDSLYLLINGRLKATVIDEKGNEQVVGEIVDGEGVGEMQMLTGEPRSANVYASRDSELVKISKDTFDRLLVKYPPIMSHITQGVIKRLQQTVHPTPASRLSLALDIVLVPAGPYIPLDEFAQELTVTLEKLGSTMFLNRDRFDNYLGKEGAADIDEDDPNNIRLITWLNAQESRYDFRIYQTDFSITPWTKRCLRQADQVLIVGNADADPTPGPIETDLLPMMHEQQSFWQALVLLHMDPNKPPENTHRWLKLRNVEKHYHLRWRDDAHYRRLARFLTGRAVGLVLGGGGSHGFAHLGVIRAMKELGIEIDLVGGTSFGALVGSLYALEWDYDTMFNQAKQFTNPRLVYDYTLPLSGFVKGAKFNNILKQLVGNTQIEDTWRPFFCVSTDLRTAQEVNHHTGPLWKYVRASTALPIAFPPVIEGNMILMDGGIINNLPLDVMRSINGNGPLIGVDITVESGLMDEYPQGATLSGWKAFFSRFNPFTPTIKVPSLGSILFRWWVITSIRRRKEQMDLADFYVRPQLAAYDKLELDAFEEIIEEGYNAGKTQLSEWLATNPFDNG